MKDNIYINQNNLENNTILIKTDKDVMKIQPDLFDTHLNNLKMNLTILNKDFTQKNCLEIKKYLDLSHKDLQRFIIENKSPDMEINDDFYKLDQELLRNKLLNRSDLSQLSDKDDIYTQLSEEQLELKLSLLDVIRDIETITLLLRNSRGENGRLDLINLHSVIEKMYQNKCLDGYGNELESELIYDDLLLRSNYDQTHIINHEFMTGDNDPDSSRCKDDNSYSSSSYEDMLLQEYGMPGKHGGNLPQCKSLDKSQLSQSINGNTINNWSTGTGMKYSMNGLFQDSYNYGQASDNYCNEGINLNYSGNLSNLTNGLNVGNYTAPKIRQYTTKSIISEPSVIGESCENLSLKSFDPCNPNSSMNSAGNKSFCDIEQMREEKNKIKKLSTDMNFNRSLRNDYDYLDA